MVKNSLRNFSKDFLCLDSGLGSGCVSSSGSDSSSGSGSCGACSSSDSGFGLSSGRGIWILFGLYIRNNLFLNLLRTFSLVVRNNPVLLKTLFFD